MPESVYEIIHQQDVEVSAHIYRNRLLQAFGSHAIVDDEFDDIFELDLVDNNGRFNIMMEPSNVY